MRIVHVANDLMSAHLVAGLLRSRGIEAFVGNDATAALGGALAISEGALPTVFVSDADHARAKQALGEDLPGGACRR